MGRRDRQTADESTGGRVMHVLGCNKKRLKEVEANELLTNCQQLKLKAAGIL